MSVSKEKFLYLYNNNPSLQSYKEKFNLTTQQAKNEMSIYEKHFEELYAKFIGNNETSTTTVTVTLTDPASLVSLTLQRLNELLLTNEVDEVVSGGAGSKAMVLTRRLDSKDLKTIAEALYKLQEVKTGKADSESLKSTLKTLKIEFVEAKNEDS